MSGKTGNVSSKTGWLAGLKERAQGEGGGGRHREGERGRENELVFSR